MQSATLTKIIPALVKARGQFKAAAKTATNPHFKSKYVPLDGVVDAINEALLANGIYACQQTRMEAAQTILVTRFYHESGEWIGGEYPIHPVKPDPQALGSAMTYARRYALMALAGIPAEDDDGNAATANVQTVKVTPADGVWDGLDSDTQQGLEALAITVREFLAEGDVKGAYQRIERDKLGADEKTGLWTLLNSKERAALKKHHDNKDNQ